MATIESRIIANISFEVMDLLGNRLAMIAEAFDPDNRPVRAQKTPEEERSRFNSNGVSAVILSYSVDEMTVNERHEKPHRDGAIAELMPAGAAMWEAGFDLWGRPQSYSWDHSYMRVINHGSGYLTLRAYSYSQDKAMEIMATARAVLEEFPLASSEADPRGFRVFIAYGGGRAWEVVRDYLKRASIQVDAFTEAERAGSVTLDVVSEMIHSASMAVIVMTATDEMVDGSMRARQNVVHETGFAQGALGTRNTIILLEEGVEPPSNIAGVTYIPFAPGEIHTTEERVVALLEARMTAAR